MLIIEEIDDGEPPPELLTTREVAEIYRVSRSTVLSWATNGQIPYFTTPSGRLRFRRATIEHDLAERTHNAAEG